MPGQGPVPCHPISHRHAVFHRHAVSHRHAVPHCHAQPHRHVVCLVRGLRREGAEGAAFRDKFVVESVCNFITWK
jgi:hypothetical protein